jgi:CheY-like chemotaxis protein
VPFPVDPLVLVVDDFADARELYAESFRMVGYRVAEAASGSEAVEKARALAPSAILMDLSLPGMDGWEATRQLKADGRTRHIPVVALTGHALSHTTERAHAVGCECLLIKPALPDQVVAAVRAVITGSDAGKRG